MDYLEHTISYQVPLDKVNDVLALDGSMKIYRVGGELSARCDLESNNILTLNLAADVASGKKTVDEARKAFGDIVMQRTLGKNPSYALALQFQPPKSMAAADPDKVTIEGTPQRPKPGSAEAQATQPKTDGEILAMVIALDENEVRGAMEAEQKKVDAQILDYAKKLHQEHGMNIRQTVQLGEKLDITPSRPRPRTSCMTRVRRHSRRSFRCRERSSVTRTSSRW
jgi:hypothetical protein